VTPRRFMNELTGRPLALVLAEQADNLLLMESAAPHRAALLLGCLSSCSNPMARKSGEQTTPWLGAVAKGPLPVANQA